jgi:hypothetical protein
VIGPIPLSEVAFPELRESLESRNRIFMSAVALRLRPFADGDCLGAYIDEKIQNSFIYI